MRREPKKPILRGQPNRLVDSKEEIELGDDCSLMDLLEMNVPASHHSKVMVEVRYYQGASTGVYLTWVVTENNKNYDKELAVWEKEKRKYEQEMVKWETEHKKWQEEKVEWDKEIERREMKSLKRRLKQLEDRHQEK